MSERNIAEIIRRLSQDFLEGGWPKWCVEPTNRYHYLTCVPRNFPPPPHPKKNKTSKRFTNSYEQCQLLGGTIQLNLSVKLESVRSTVTTRCLMHSIDHA